MDTHRGQVPKCEHAQGGQVPKCEIAQGQVPNVGIHLKVGLWGQVPK